jgi:hypothetical protein
MSSHDGRRTFQKDPAGSQHIRITGGTGKRKTGMVSHQYIIE